MRAFNRKQLLMIRKAKAFLTPDQLQSVVSYCQGFERDFGLAHAAGDETYEENIALAIERYCGGESADAWLSQVKDEIGG